MIVSNTGPSGLIADDGSVIKLFEPNTEQNGIVNPNFSNERTFYTKYGERPLLFLFILLGALNLFFRKSTNYSAS